MSDETRVWLVERTYSDDEQNLIILTHATPDDKQDFRKERTLTSFSGDHREMPVSLAVDAGNLSSVDDAATREQYSTEAARMAEEYEPDATL
ncbi:MAG: hypothetical protein J07HN6_02713 [Halonotius sp. J07HN6]|nr:MAG: hypothetical protein J07HN6_02713 [Halonotius sp. J07HN6]